MEEELGLLSMAIMAKSTDHLHMIELSRMGDGHVRDVWQLPLFGKVHTEESKIMYE